MDSFAGFVFFLLIGKWFQNYTYDHLAFDNSIDSYFPLVVSREKGKNIEVVKTNEITKGDIIVLRQDDILPVDGEILQDVHIDYSFVSGESDAVSIKKGNQVYSGGKLLSDKARLKVKSGVDNSRLAEIWRESASEKTNANPQEELIKTVSKYFLICIIVIAIIAGISWYFIDASKSLFVMTSVLIVACPCALALSLPFVVGNASRTMGKWGCYIRDARKILSMSKTNVVVFDKTGTITSTENKEIVYEGKDLTDETKERIRSTVELSGHPKSRQVANFLKSDKSLQDTIEFKNFPGKGIMAKFKSGEKVELGSAEFLGQGGNDGAVHVKINAEYQGKYLVSNSFRKGLKELVYKLKKSFQLRLISGDSDKDKPTVLENGFLEREVLFNQSPVDKKSFVQELKQNNNQVLMVGDGLNDTGALKEADFGIAVSDNIYGYLPECDAILEGHALTKLYQIIHLSQKAASVLKWCYLVSFLYNIIGLYFALSGQLSPLIAAILMPLSSITIVLLSTLALKK